MKLQHLRTGEAILGDVDQYLKKLLLHTVSAIGVRIVVFVGEHKQVCAVQLCTNFLLKSWTSKRDTRFGPRNMDL